MNDGNGWGDKIHSLDRSLHLALHGAPQLSEFDASLESTRGTDVFSVIGKVADAASPSWAFRAAAIFSISARMAASSPF
jgi:hypothetical protein